MNTHSNSHRGHRFPREIISQGVWLYYRFSLSLRDVEALLAKRGITVAHDNENVRCEGSSQRGRRSGSYGSMESSGICSTSDATT